MEGGVEGEAGAVARDEQPDVEQPVVAEAPRHGGAEVVVVRREEEVRAVPRAHRRDGGVWRPRVRVYVDRLRAERRKQRGVSREV